MPPTWVLEVDVVGVVEVEVLPADDVHRLLRGGHRGRHRLLVVDVLERPRIVELSLPRLWRPNHQGRRVVLAVRNGPAGLGTEMKYIPLLVLHKA